MEKEINLSEKLSEEEFREVFLMQNLIKLKLDKIKEIIEKRTV